VGDAVTSQGRELVLVLGPGRSGTSTMAGALARTGFQVPDALDGDDSNPTGFYEPAWAVDFHTRLLERVCVHTLDGDPAAYDELAKVLADPEPGAELTDWLATELAAHPRLVIKDPRLVWFRDLWVTAAQSAGVSPAFVVMLRHPAEVSSSRSEFYDAPQGTAVAGWINVVLLTERLTRGSRRAFVTYAYLLTDWRPVLSTMSARLDLHLDPAPDVSTHPIDEFIDPELRRREPDWSALAVPASLQDLGDRTYATITELASAGDQDSTRAALDALAEEYAHVHADAVAIAHAHWRRKVRRARRAGVRAGEERAASEAPAASKWSWRRGRSR